MSVLERAYEHYKQFMPKGAREYGLRWYDKESKKVVFKRNEISDDPLDVLKMAEEKRGEAFMSVKREDANEADFIVDIDTFPPLYLVVENAVNPEEAELTLKRKPEPADKVVGVWGPAFVPRSVLAVKELLESLGCKAFVFFSGGKGFHVYAECPFAEHLTVRELRAELITWLVDETGAKADIPVSVDLRRLVRLPLSINMKTKLRKVPIGFEPYYILVAKEIPEGVSYALKRVLKVRRSGVYADFTKAIVLKKGFKALREVKEGLSETPPRPEPQLRTDGSQARRTAQPSELSSTSSEAPNP